MITRKSDGSIREPVQVYLSESDRTALNRQTETLVVTKRAI